jgi:hypothetical protein
MTCLSGTSSLKAGANLTVRSRFLLAQAVGTLGCGASSLRDFVINAQDTFELAHWVNFSESPWH